MKDNFDFSEYFNQFIHGFQETKQQITEKYVKGLIDKEEFIRRMNNARD